MNIEIAIARDGFINCKTTGLVEPTNKNDFEQVLKAFFEFETKSLLGFDGVRCDIETPQSPVNSIFIYKNDTGKFLYQIQTAVPKIHKNKLIWSCGVYQLDTFENIQQVINDNLPYIDLKQGLAPKWSSFPLKSSRKDNFKGNSIFYASFVSSSGGVDVYNIATLKIKCFVDPTNTGLVSNAPDGSFTFYYPILAKYRGSGSFTTGLKLKNGKTTLNFANVLSKYSNNIKSIEFLPFLCNWTETLGTDLQPVDAYKVVDLTSASKGANNTLVVEIIDGNEDLVKFTDLGMFVTQEGVGNYRNWAHFVDASGNLIDTESFASFPRRLCLGGGAVGFVQCPMGNIPLDFEKSTEIADTGMIRVGLLDDGFVVRGGFIAEIPAHFVNFYTDSSGTIFINQQTNYKYELQQMNLQNEQKAVQSGLSSGKSFLGNLVTGDFGGAVGDLLGFGTDIGTQMIDADYQRKMFDAKVDNETLLAKLSGKQVGGSITISQFLETYKGFAIVVEKNFEKPSNSAYFICQKDFDYSTPYLKEEIALSIDETNTLYDNIKKMFGIDTSIFTFGNYWANYNFAFRFCNKLKNKNFTNLLQLPVRFLTPNS